MSEQQGDLVENCSMYTFGLFWYFSSFGFLCLWGLPFHSSMYLYLLLLLSMIFIYII